MARFIHLSRKLKLAKAGRRTRWAPFWTVPKIYGKSRRIHPGRHTVAKRSWRKGIQLEQKNVDKAEKDKQVAISMEGVTIGRQVHEGDILYSDMTENEFRKLKELKSLLSADEISLLKEIAEIKRKQSPMWGV